MTHRRGFRLLIGIALLCVSLGALVFAQSPAAARPAPPATMDDVLKELKGIRADLAQSSSATIKTQLLVARLQVEEQRINGISKQIMDVQTQLATVRQGLAPLESQVKRFEDMFGGTGFAAMPENERKGITQMIADVKSRFEAEQRREQDLMAQEGALANQFAAEQGRWSDFNDRLDALERSLSAR